MLTAEYCLKNAKNLKNATKKQQKQHSSNNPDNSLTSRRSDRGKKNIAATVHEWSFKNQYRPKTEVMPFYLSCLFMSPTTGQTMFQFLGIFSSV